MEAMPPKAGLCGECKHSRSVPSDRGAIFVMCGLSATDGRFPKYPRLPVLTCSGYSRLESGEKEQGA